MGRGDRELRVCRPCPLRIRLEDHARDLNVESEFPRETPLEEAKREGSPPEGDRGRPRGAVREGPRTRPSRPEAVPSYL